jgi:sulfonate transport system ATP-binding protein
VLLITHDVEEAILLADRALVIDRGRIIASITIDLPRRRDLSQSGFISLRTQLLNAIGVIDTEFRQPHVLDPHLAAGVDDATRIALA